MSAKTVEKADLITFEEGATDYAAVFDPVIHSVLSSPTWLGALPRGSVRLARYSGRSVPAFLPVSVGRRRGIPIVTNPVLTPWVEIVGGSAGSKRVGMIGDLHASSGAIAELLRRRGVVRIRLHRSTASWLGFHWSGFLGNARISYVVSGTSAEVWGSMKGATRTTIRASARHGLTIRPLAPEELVGAVSLFELHSAGKGFAYALDAEQLRSFFATTVSSGCGTVRGAFDTQGRLVGAAFFADDARTRIYLMGAQDESGAKSNAISGLVWNAIDEALHEGREFDFEGSMLPRVEEFARAFGGEQRTDVTVVWIPRPRKTVASLRARLAH